MLLNTYFCPYLDYSCPCFNEDTGFCDGANLGPCFHNDDDGLMPRQDLIEDRFNDALRQLGESLEQGSLLPLE